MEACGWPLHAPWPPSAAIAPTTLSCRPPAHPCTAELCEAQAALEAKGAELAGVSAELAAARGQLADASAAMHDAHDQLSELQVGPLMGGWGAWPG